jgi:hypothetical protein
VVWLAVAIVAFMIWEVYSTLVNQRQSPEAQAPASSMNASSAIPAPATIPPEIRIADFMLQPRSKVEVVLGKAIRQGECQDTTGQQYEYSDDSYLCVDHGRVILLSYTLHAKPSTGNDALDAVGLHTTIQPFAPYGRSLNVWSAERGNPLIVGTRYAHQVTAIIGQVNSVQVDMTGATETHGTSKNSSEVIKPEETTKESANGTVSLGQIVAAINQGFMSQYGTKLILDYKDGRFAAIEMNPKLWERLTPLQQKAVGMNFAKSFSGTGGINCHVQVYGVEVGLVSPSVFGGWQYEPE